eukprot:CAMPEP_0196731506 /NCGR_PEP_ID=MMETSP1091-20130531/11205_1 /TAXON_ID=302021 /ORGANISM="Rhodomonas sp., Strain CCMP768" /LENGTH=236 /DNA_ID=CAMNT_0042074645 /DNA_START=35 /DNA_END=745 /DNA_ORIENTATION=-
MRAATFFLLTACASASPLFVTQPAALRLSHRSEKSMCKMQHAWPGGTRPGGLAAREWADHDKAVFDATVSGLEQYQEAWDAHDEAMYSALEKVAELPRKPVSLKTLVLSALPSIFNAFDGLPKPFAAKWSRHDEAVVTQLSNLDASWAKHDDALFSQTMAVLEAGPGVVDDAWLRHDLAVFSALFDGDEEAQLRERRAIALSRKLAQSKKSLRELTTTLVRGVDDGFEGDAYSFSV